MTIFNILHVPGTVLSVLHLLTILIVTKPSKILLAPLETQRKDLPQGFPAGEWQS